LLTNTVNIDLYLMYIFTPNKHFINNLIK
jgi:hypothetical protein